MHTILATLDITTCRINISVVLTAENGHAASINGTATDLDHCWVR